MNFLRKLYSGAFKLEKKVTKPFVIKLVVYAIIYLVVSVVIGGIMGGMGVLALYTEPAAIDVIAYIVIALLGLVEFLFCIYIVGGIVVSILKFVGVIKDDAGNGEKGEFGETADKVGGKVGSFFDKVVDKTTGVVNNVVDKVTDKKDDEEATEEEATEESSNDAE